MSRENSIKISYGMFISCVVIVLHHSVGDTYFLTEDRTFGYQFFRFLHYGLFSFSMPFFFFWSGFFCERKAEINYKDFLINKLRSLVVPYLLWNAIWTLFGVLIFMVGIKGTVFSWDGNIDSIVQGLLFFKYNGQYWYMLEIIALSLCVKAIDRVVNSRILFFVAICFVLFLMIVLKNDTGWFSLEGFMAYLCGAYFSIHNEEKKKISLNIWIWIFFVVIVGNTFLVELAPSFLITFMNYVSFIAFWNVLDLFSKLKVYSWMENYFFIYSIHETPQLIIDKFLSVILPFNGFFAAIITTILGAFLTICGANILILFLQKKVFTLFMMLNGNRKKINS